MHKGLVKGLLEFEIGGRTENLQITTLVKSAKIESWKPEEICCLSDSNEKQSANGSVKNSAGQKAEIEGFIIAAQNQRQPTRKYLTNIIKKGSNPI